MEKGQTRERCPRSGYWRQIETREKIYFNEGDLFPFYYKLIGKDNNGTPLYEEEPLFAHYEFVSEYES
jgi:hypothetical protein